ncbi:MAG: glycosyltransferase family 4 protein [Sulfuricurvum sp.]|nr:glycosyltransferase family 4 protein [Sulfuricurvum sp.]
MIMVTSLVYGGCETQVINIVKALIKKGAHVFLFILEQNVPRLNELSSEIDSKKLTYHIGSKTNMFDVQSIQEIRRCCREWQPDIIHSFLYHSDIYSRLANLDNKLPILNSERNHGYNLKFKQKFLHYITRWRTTGLIANSYAGAEFAIKRYKLEKKHVHTVWNGIDIPSINQKADEIDDNIKERFFFDPNIKLATMIASIKPQKNHLYAIEIASQLTTKHTNWRVLFVGSKFSADSSDYPSEVHQAYNKKCNTEKVKFIGNRNDIAAVLKQSDVTFLTSYFEGFPNVVLEAMALGIPIVSTDYSDIRHILQFSHHIIEQDNPTKFVNAILECNENKHLYTNEYIKWVTNYASIDVMVKKLIEIYDTYIQH